ncbi:hypothetical protein TNCV_1008821, partial [Trichonephila clavipes]
WHGDWRTRQGRRVTSSSWAETPSGFGGKIMSDSSGFVKRFHQKAALLVCRSPVAFINRLFDKRGPCPARCSGIKNVMFYSTPLQRSLTTTLLYHQAVCSMKLSSNQSSGD